jgi:hypothetical protein
VRVEDTKGNRPPPRRFQRLHVVLASESPGQFQVKTNGDSDDVKARIEDGPDRLRVATDSVARGGRMARRIADDSDLALRAHRALRDGTRVMAAMDLTAIAWPAHQSP